MKHRIFCIALTLMTIEIMQAQQLLDRINYPLSSLEKQHVSQRQDILLEDYRTLHSNPVYTELISQTDSAIIKPLRSIIYAGVASGEIKGDFLPYEGNGAQDYRIGAYGEYANPHCGILFGTIQFSQGKHRNISWSATRMPELYLPYVSTDSCGGDFKYESYYVDGNYAFTLNKKWTIGVKATFEGEQAYRLSDPRALNNTTWLRFNTGVAYSKGQSHLLLDAGYGRNKQHMQLHYWRPGQQDRFFVCYGFGLYDTRQSGVSFGKARMYYIDNYNARLQYMSPTSKNLRLHASIGYSYDHMVTEESDIYNLYESRTHTFNPHLLLTYETVQNWRFDLSANGNLFYRKGYENIIEEYLIDKENNIYDFRTIDTQQYYRHDEQLLTIALRTTKIIGATTLSIQGGITQYHRREEYRDGLYSTECTAMTPHLRFGIVEYWKKEKLDIRTTYGHQAVYQHHYDVLLQNQQIAHLDFQHTFAPYAYYTSNYDYLTIDFTYTHQLEKKCIGLSGLLLWTDGNRLSDVAYQGIVGFPSTAPMIKTTPDKHQNLWGRLTIFLQF